MAEAAHSTTASIHQLSGSSPPNAVTQGSRTAPMQAGKEMVDAATAPRDYVIPKEASLGGMIGHGAEYLARKAAGAVASASGEATRNYMARMLSLSGPELDAFLAESAARTRADHVQALVRGLQGSGHVAVPVALDARGGR